MSGLTGEPIDLGLTLIIIDMLFQCPECGNMVSDKASQCPKCGYAVPKGTSAPSNLATDVSTENNATKNPQLQHNESLQLLLVILSYLCYAFAVIDLVLVYIFDIDLTGFYWTTVVACAAGAILSAISDRV